MEEGGGRAAGADGGGGLVGGRVGVSCFISARAIATKQLTAGASGPWGSKLPSSAPLRSDVTAEFFLKASNHNGWIAGILLLKSRTSVLPSSN